MKETILKILAPLLFLAQMALAQGSPGASIAYLANDGFLVTSGGKSVLIDALFNESFGQYAVPTESLKAQMMRGDLPFDRADLYLVTHRHGDHFDARTVAGFLFHHPESLLLSSEEVCDQCRDAGLPRGRYRSLPLGVGAVTDTVAQGIPLTAVRLKHMGDSTGLRVTNLAYLIRLPGATLLHCGDITFEDAEPLLDRIDWKAAKVDVLFLSSFDLSEKTARYVRQVIKPKFVVAMHLSPGEFDSASKAFLSVFPDGIVFKNPMDVKVIGE